MAGASRESAAGKALADLLDRYFTQCDELGKRPTLAGLRAFGKAEKTESLVQRVERTIGRYLDQCEESGTVPSEQELARALDVSTRTLRRWCDGEQDPELQEVVEGAYARITGIYMQLLTTGNKNMTPFVIFMLKQPRFAGYQDKIEAKQDIAVNVKMGANVDASDFQ